MKNSFLFFFLSIFLFTNSYAENLKIEANSITLDKKNNT